MMKKFILGGYLLLVILNGCSNRVELGFSSESSDEANTVEVNFGGSFGDFDLHNLRTYPTEASEIRKQRTTFKGVRIVLYSVDPVDKTQPDKVAYVFDKDVVAVFGEFSGADFAGLDEAGSGAFGFKFKSTDRIKADDYIVYTFATVNSELKAATAIGQPFSALEGTMNYILDEDFKFNRLENNYYISQPIKISKEMFVDNQVNRVYSIPTARLTALNAIVSVKWAPNVQDANVEILEDLIRFYPDVQNLTYTLFPTHDEYLDTTYGLKYPVDANYTGFSAKSMDELATQFLYRTNLSEASRFSSYLSPNSVSRYRALPENTMASSESKANVITRLIIRVRMIPTSLKKALTPDQLASASLGWVNYLGTPYEAEAFVSMYTAAKAKSTKSAEESKLIDIAERFLVHGALPDVRKEDGGYEDKDVQYYHCGYSFFAIPITHYSIDQLGGSVDNGGYFGVVRNTHYEYDIKSFAGLGRTNYKYLPYDLDYLSERFVEHSQVIVDMEDVKNIINVLY